MTMPKGYANNKKNKDQGSSSSPTKYVKPSANASPPPFQPHPTRVRSYNYNSRPQQPKRDTGTRNLTALFVIGIILALIGFTGLGFTPLGESVTGWGILAGVGLFMVIGGILYVTIAVGRGHR